ncbi:MAG TPA: D-alanyl-D-alanine carboxypeptidase [Candidatus Mediterraneibacter colneyensis]|nr:D-alanyl-D-alanine carboxypeptidase [Candidatus Mediterraneibacter colneyensis]
MDHRARRRSRMRRKRRQRQRFIAAVLICLVVLAGAGTAAGVFITGQFKNYTADYEAEYYNNSLYQGTMFSSDICVTAEEVSLEGFEPDPEVNSAGLFDLEQHEVLCGYNLFEKVYPASTTKVMTAYVALKYGNLDDVVTVSDHAVDFNWDEVTCGLRAGDTVTMYDLLCGLILHSGNDCGTAIAEHISGSEEAFADLMNQEAAALGATGSHFVNPHGLHDDNHYTTAYDLYLIFNACIQDERFVEIISMDSYTGTLNGADGTVRTETWKPTNLYNSGRHDMPQGIRVLGGKTGTTKLAGNCLIIYDENMEQHPYISVIMGAPNRDTLYAQMDLMMTQGITGDQTDQASTE